MSSLFKLYTLQFTKTAAEASLPTDPNVWGREVLQELYKQAPFVADYNPVVVMARVDGERGYGFGHIELKAKTALQGEQQKDPNAQLKSVRVPILISQNKLKSFDLMLNEESKSFPLTERRLRTAIFRPQLFDMTSAVPKSQGLGNMLYPPHRDGHSMTAGSGEGFGKMGSLLALALPHAAKGDVDRFEAEVMSTPKLAEVYKANQQSHEALAKIATIERQPTRAEVQPTVVQFVKEGSAYKVRAASAHDWRPTEMTLDRADFYKLAKDVSQEVDTTGAVTVGLEDGLAEEAPEDATPVGLIAEPGVYKVQDQGHHELIGLAIPGLLDLDGSPLPICLFSNGAAVALQGEIAGVRVGDAANLPATAEARGYGCFYRMDQNGRPQALIPMMLEAPLATPTGAGIMGTTYDGRQITVMRQKGVSKPAEVNGAVLVPLDFKWMPLVKGKALALVDSPADFAAKPPVPEEEVEIGSDSPSTFDIKGKPVEKLSSDERMGLNIDDMTFYLTALGVPSDTMRSKLAQALRGKSSVRVKVARSLERGVPVNHQKLAHDAQMMQLRRNLVKEAAVLPDPLSIDTVLSLNFLTSANAEMFVAGLPQMDETQQRLCDLLLAVRLGQRDIPEDAIVRSIKSLEEVIEGLRTIAFAQ